MQEFVIHRNISDDGIVEISQDRQIRSLYFGNDAKQSSMDLNQPERLVLSYTRAMMSCLLFHPAPKKILLIGLGGGSIAKFLLHHFPDCHIDAVEIRNDVVKLAHGYFALPEHPNLQIFITDAFQLLTNNEGRYKHYDLILVDAFNHDGVSDSVKTLEFFSLCHQRMTHSAILSINLWDSHTEQCASTINVIEHTFQQNVLSLPVIDKGNLIMLAAREKNVLQLSSSRLEADHLEQTLGLEYSSMYRQLRRANRWRKLGKLFVRVDPGLG